MRRVRVCIGLLALLSGGGWVGAEDKPKEPAPPKGPRFADKAAGVSARGPEGWSMKADQGAPTEWTRLVTFNDPVSDADIVFSVRKKDVSSGPALLAKVRKEWAQGGPGLRVSAMRAVEATPMTPVTHVIVDGSFVRKPKARKGVPSAPVPYRVNATYYLGPNGEYLLYAKAQETHWSRIRPRLRKVRASVTFTKAVGAHAGGRGSYRNDKVGFTCSYPPESAVVVTAYTHQVVGFVPPSNDDPTIEIYRLAFEGTPEEDSRRLITFYVEDQGGEAERSDMTIVGKEASLVTAKADVGGVERSIRIATFQRNDNTTWRIKVTGPVGDDGKVDEALRTFIDGFKLTRPGDG